jgi:hypothetical protein
MPAFEFGGKRVLHQLSFDVTVASGGRKQMFNALLAFFGLLRRRNRLSK